MNGTTINSDVGGAVAALPSSAGDFIALMKPRVMSLVVFTGAVGIWLAPGDLHPVLAAVAVLCIALGSGAAGAINMWFDRDIDAVMTRTAARPIPMGRVAADDALGFGVFCSIGAVALLGLATNWLAAGLLAATIGFYVFVYTMWLKRRTPQNIVIGGAAGAFPPVIGWAAVTGTVDLVPLALFALVFFWTPPHFWALALYSSADYARAGVPMMPVVAGRRSTKRQILVYTLLLLPLALVPWALGAAGMVYAAGALALGLVFVAAALRVLAEPDAAGDRAARQMFGFSILYLFMIFGLLAVDGGGAQAWHNVAW
ncbi:MAG: protoheme IX farnesyltransferase [Alphaproteobacteria bacterium]|nr:protoheme IX farnesyltransferase [Alphaproteobacteria bacterium]